MNELKMKKVVGYARISSDSQKENTSIEEQKRKIRGYCDIHDLELATDIFVDEGFSGSEIKSRKGYLSMLDYMRKHQDELHAIIVLKMDRAHRHQLNLLRFIKEELAEMQIEFVSISESFDTSTPFGRMMLGVLSTFGEFEREIIVERTRGGRLATAKNKKYAGGEPPFGYKLKENPKLGECIFEIIPAEEKVIKRIFKEFISGASLYSISAGLNKEKIKTKNGKKWGHSQIRYILQNNTYTGNYSYLGKNDTQHIQKNELKEYVGIENIYPRLISDYYFKKAKEEIKNRHTAQLEKVKETIKDEKEIVQKAVIEIFKSRQESFD